MIDSRTLTALATIVVAAGCSTSQSPALPRETATGSRLPELEAEPVVALPSTVPLEAEKLPVQLTIAAVGDMMLGTDYPENRLPDDDGAGFLEAVTPIISAADLAFGNLEGVLADGGKPAKACRSPRSCYLFRSPTRYAEHYRRAGFDMLSLANNHARDFGLEGWAETMRALDAAGIHHSGREGEFASLVAGSLKIAMLAFAVTKDSNLLHDYDLARSTVGRYANEHDIVIVSFHGGREGPDAIHLPFAEEEYYGEPRGDVVYFARTMVDAGADLVIGHGPHVVRAMEIYKDRLIAYSLGNFATYYGISVAGLSGIAPILLATLDREGRFLGGELVSTVQLRPDGPSIDPENRALNLVRGLSLEDFADPGLVFTHDGKLLPRAGRQSRAPSDLKSMPNDFSLR